MAALPASDRVFTCEVGGIERWDSRSKLSCEGGIPEFNLDLDNQGITGSAHFSLAIDCRLCKHSSLKGAVIFEAIIVKQRRKIGEREEVAQNSERGRIYTTHS